MDHKTGYVAPFTLFSGVCLLLFDLTRSTTLLVTETQTAVYDDVTSCISFGELDLVVDVNLTDPDTKQVPAFREVLFIQIIVVVIVFLYNLIGEQIVRG